MVREKAQSPFVRTIEVIVKHEDPVEAAFIVDLLNALREVSADAQIAQIKKLDFNSLKIPEPARQTAIDYIENNRDYILWLESVASTESSKLVLKMAFIGFAFLSLLAEKSVEEIVKGTVEKSHMAQTVITSLAKKTDEALQPIADTLNLRHEVPAHPHCPSISTRKTNDGLRIIVMPSVPVKLDFFQPKTKPRAEAKKAPKRNAKTPAPSHRDKSWKL